jgi:hypothetical protein
MACVCFLDLQKKNILLNLKLYIIEFTMLNQLDSDKN